MQAKRYLALHLAIRHSGTAVCGLGIASMAKKMKVPGRRALARQVLKLKGEVVNMKKYLLLPLLALGLVAWVPNQAKAGVHVTFGFGVPGYYYAPYYGDYYPDYGYYYYHPYWHRWHHYYHHYRHWHHR